MKEQHVYIDKPSNFRAIFRPDINTVIWRRDLDPNFLSYCNFIAENYDINIVNKALESHIIFSESLNSLNKINLFADIAYLTNTFISLFNKCDFKFNTSGTDDSRKYHTDKVKYRMIANYAGPPQEVLDSRLVRRQYLDSNQEIDTTNYLIRSLAPQLHLITGDVILIRGDSNAEHPNFGAVHRDPAIEKQGLRTMSATFTRK